MISISFSIDSVFFLIFVLKILLITSESNMGLRNLTALIQYRKVHVKVSQHKTINFTFTMYTFTIMTVNFITVSDIAGIRPLNSTFALGHFLKEFHMLKYYSWTRYCISHVVTLTLSFPGGTSGKEHACQCRRHRR